jgi:hypothetical protein
VHTINRKPRQLFPSSEKKPRTFFHGKLKI